METKKKINLIGISGKIGSGKDTVGMMIQALTMDDHSRWRTIPLEYIKAYEGRPNCKGGFQIKKFAGHLKTFVSIATGIPVEKLEDQKVKTSYLGREWSYVREERFLADNGDVEIRPIRYYLTPRDILQKLGTEVGRQVHSQFWVNALFAGFGPTYTPVDKDVDLVPEKQSQWIITDMRFPNEVDAIKQRDGITIRVNRKSDDIRSSHISETALDGWEFDHVIENDGTLEELLEKVKLILEQYEL